MSYLSDDGREHSVRWWLVLGALTWGLLIVMAWRALR